MEKINLIFLIIIGVIFFVLLGYCAYFKIKSKKFKI